MSEVDRVDGWISSGLQLTVRDEGPLDGPAVVLLHGFPQRASSWDEVAAVLHERGVRTLAPDLRGYSPGARPPRRRDYQLPLLAADVAALLERTGPAHLVGHDWGAAVAWTTAADYPVLVRSLTAVSVPHPAAFLSSMLRSNQLLRSWYMLFFQLPWLPEYLLSGPRAGRRALRAIGMTDPMIRAFRAEIVEDGALRGGLNYYRALPLTDLRRAWDRVGVPTTHVWSDNDPALGRKGAELTEEYVDGDYRLELLPGVGHWVPEEAPEHLADIICDRIGQR